MFAFLRYPDTPLLRYGDHLTQVQVFPIVEDKVFDGLSSRLKENPESRL